ncbi:DNA topoisomerase IV subunit A [Ammoniphilus sp. CFH 90114]|uniref:DNA topoisomerase IV subunit A n=1 Tax=Ammoniphilus sp. CFH 90114 TaxID=2493665 RepID=UPI00100F3EB9|nr:DNA topoisomerase IV subunit A [Ammoniphilus sp. CFH 90114]RXT08106.1 DNA topoisomerase IV subunit A [Ammoniphilus sp. CFH 90114]
MSLFNQDYMQMSVRDVYRSRFSDYARYIILSRAIPDVRDGLKPVQRRVLYSMYKERNLPDRPYRKSAKTVGDVMGNYHPHGDSSIYETMVNLVQNHKMREPLIDGHGHWGTVDGDSAAAMRYTEARLTEISTEMLRDIEKDTVDFIPNYDNTTKEPTILPSRFPNLLVNGVTGISIGFATEIPTHNLREVIKGSIALLNNPDITLDELMTYIPGPDLPLGGIIQGKSEIKKAYRTGSGRIVIRSKTHVEKGKQGRQLIVIDEIPYTVKKKALVQQIDEEIIDKNVDGLLEVRDETDREGLRIVLEVRKDAEIEGILNYLYKKTDLQISYSFNMLVISDTHPKQMGLKEILQAYIEHQKEVVTRRTQYDYDKAEKRLHIVEGIIKAISILREVIDTIMDSDGREDARENLISKYDFTYEQAEAILDIRLHQLTRLDIKKYEKEEKELLKKLKEWNAILTSEKQLKKVIEKELAEIGEKYGNERRTVIQDEIETIEVDISITVPSEDVIVTLSEDLYIKRVSLRSFTSSGGTLETAGVKEGDKIKYFLRVNTIHSLLLFTNDGMYYQVPIHEIPDARWKDPGTALVNVVGLGKDQKIIGVIPIEDFNQPEVFVHFATSKGMVKKTALTEYATNYKKRGIAAVKVKEDDRVVQVFLAGANDQMLMVSKEGMAIQFALKEVNPMGRNTAGVKAMKLSDTDDMIDAFVTKEEDERVLAILTTDGTVKRIYVSDFLVQARGGKGLLVIRKRKTKPHRLIYVLLESDTAGDLYFVTNKGQEAIVPVDTIDISDQGGAGKDLLSLEKGEEVIRAYQRPIIPEEKHDEDQDIS